MIKKFFKWSFGLFLGIILLGLLAYGGFHLWEYATGGKYVKYLSDNGQTIALDKSFDFNKLGKDVESNQLILVGEIHGCDEPNKFDVELFKYLNKNHNVNHYLAELDFVQGKLMNDFLVTGNEDILKDILKEWVVFQGRNNQDYFDKYIALHQYYQSLPEDDKFEIIGVDRLQDVALAKKYLVKLYFNNDTEKDEALEGQLFDKILSGLDSIYADNPDTLFMLSHMRSNAEFLNNKVNRDEVMYQNFSSVYKEYQLEENKIYGYFGLGHVFQYRVNGHHPFASRVRKSDMGLEDKIMTINIMMNDSHMVMPSNSLPEFMRDEGPYTKMALSADNMLFIYIVGIKDFKRMTPKHHKSLIKMVGENNPYANTGMRLNKTIQILPVTDVMEMTDKGKPYFQYTVFVRNSDWAEPMK